jgi:single-stranded-DNA-specific exonuclease
MDDSIWIVASPRDEAKRLASELGIPQAIAQVLINRKITEAEQAHLFLEGRLAQLHDPFLMSGMTAAVERIKSAIARREKILIFGDYDVDGVLSVVMLVKALGSLSADVEYFIPERLKEGYGIKDEHIAVAAGKGARLVISVDCGIKANGFVRKANEQGIDVIITDHHRPGPELPEALAVLNPVLESSGYPDKSLAGVGVVFKLIQALFEQAGRASVLPHYLKLVAIGTISDVAELRGENRILVKLGLQGLDSVSNQGLRSLIEICGLKGKRISEGDIGFRIGPRINAAGRMGATDLAVRLFFSPSLEETAGIARHLDELNSQRQTAEGKIHKQALGLIKKRSLDKRHKILILGCQDWHRGIIGIVASRLKDAFSRPVVLFAYEDDKAFGSGRSIGEFSLIECLDQCRHFFLTYGGHPFAVGCSLERASMPAFKQAANAVAEARLSDAELRKKILIDSKLDFSDISAGFYESHSLLYPFGVGNPRPVFLTEKAEIVGPPQNLQGRHAKFLVRQGSRVFEAIAWDRGDWAQKVSKGGRVDLAYTFQFSNYLGEDRPYLCLEGLRK